MAILCKVRPSVRPHVSHNALNLTTHWRICFAACMAVRQLLWDGFIPVELQIEGSELAALNNPQPHYCMVPRMGYLSAASVEAVSHFSSFVAAVGPQQEVWFETLDTRTPLKWYLPFGVLFDMLGDPHDLPWKLVVHFRGFPSQQLPHYVGLESVEGFFRQRFKQAMHLQHGSGNEGMNIVKATQMEIWDGVRTNNVTLYNKALGSVVAASPRLLPVRIHIGMEPPIHPAVSICKDNGDEKTLREVLAAADSRLERLESLKILCQGVEAPLDAPVFEVWKTLRHPDLYVYLVVVETRDEADDA